MARDNIMEEFDYIKEKSQSIEIDGNPSIEEIALIISLFSFKEVNKWDH